MTDRQRKGGEGQCMKTVEDFIGKKVLVRQLNSAKHSKSGGQTYEQEFDEGSAKLIVANLEIIDSAIRRAERLERLRRDELERRKTSASFISAGDSY